MNASKILFSLLTPAILLLSSEHVLAKTFYVDAKNGNDINKGTSEVAAWKSLKRVNSAHFSPGDNILFIRDGQWRGKLTIPSSGSKDRPITFGAYGSGNNPIIMRTVRFSNWTLLNNTEDTEERARVWVGHIPTLNNSWGMVKNGRSTPIHMRRQLQRSGTDTLSDGYFYSPVNSGIFYYRNDSGFPGTVEIGAYDEAVHIENKSNIVINGIDIFGPGGKQARSAGAAKGLNFKSVAISNGSNNITIKNLSISHANSIGISADHSTSNIVYENIDAHHNGGTGIYLNSTGGKIINCRSFDNGRLANGIGDRGGIGSFKGQDIVIEHNEVFRNGPDDGGADFEVSLVLTGTVKILRNYIHDCLQGCLQVAAGGDGSIIAYNVISGYGTAEGKMSSAGKLSGIRVGGGGEGSKNIHIYNNVLHGGKSIQYTSEAALFIGPFDNSGLHVINNIFADNDNKHIYIAGGKNAKLDQLQFTNNLFSSLEGGVHWKGQNFNTINDLQKYSDIGAKSMVGDPLFSNASGKFSEVSDFALQPESPAINRGIDLGITGDYSNKLVPYGSSPDIGAFEWHD